MTVLLTDDQILALAHAILDEKKTRKVISTLRQFYGPACMSVVIESGEYYRDEPDLDPDISSIAAFNEQGQALPFDRTASGWAKAMDSSVAYVQTYSEERLFHDLKHYLLHLKDFPLAMDGQDITLKTTYNLAAIGAGRAFTDVQGVPIAATVRPPLVQVQFYDEEEEFEDEDEDFEEDEDEDGSYSDETDLEDEEL